MLHIVIDSAGDLPDGWGQTYSIEVIPVNIHFGDKLYLQGIDLSNEDFYAFVKTNHQIPQTSQPSPEQFKDYYRKIAQPGETILSIHVTGKLSGTFASAQLAARDLVDEYHIVPFDSASGSAAMGYMAQEARLLDWSGASLGTILDRLKTIRQNIIIIFTLDTLEFARLSGRVNALQAALASLLSVKPIVVLRDGVLDMAERVRTRRRSFEQVIQLVRGRVGEHLINAAVVHAQDLAAGIEFQNIVKSTLNCKQLVMTELSISVAANLGPGTVGIVAYPVEEA